MSGEVQSAGLLPDQAGSFLHHPLVILIGYQLANEQVPVKNLFLVLHFCCFVNYTFLCLHPITFPSAKQFQMALEAVPPMTSKHSLFTHKVPRH